MWKNAWLACLCAALTVWWWTQRFASLPPAPTEHNTPTLTLENTTSYRYGENGLRMDTLQAHSVQYHDESGDTHFLNPVLERNTQEARFHAEGDTGLLAANDTITLIGNARMQRLTNGAVEITVTSHSLHYDPAAQALSSADEVTITTPDSRTLSQGAVWQLASNYLILEQNVRSHYEPRR